MKRLLFSACAAIVAWGPGVDAARAEYTPGITYNFETDMWNHTGPVTQNLKRVERDLDAAALDEYDEDAIETPRERRTRAARPPAQSRKAQRRSTRRAAAGGGRFVRRASPTAAVGGGQFSGVASYYWQGQRVASGGRFNPDGMTAAHKTLPFGTRVRVTHAGTGRSVEVVINDRGPFVRGRVIDLSRGAATALGMRNAGLARVNIDVLGR